MDIQILPGHLSESLRPDGGGLDRRAFGEFIGPAGELASYALGWTTGAEVGRLSIGIGAGNPGGGTFHAVVFEHDDGHAFALTDEPFERVPQGGPDLSAAEARAHEDVEFVWWVADQVFERDPRAWWLRHWLLRTRCIQTVPVFDLSEPVLLVAHDDDELWQLIGSSDAAGDGRITHLSHAIDADQTLLEVLDLAPGESATRSEPGGAWTRHRGHPSTSG